MSRVMSAAAAAAAATDLGAIVGVRLGFATRTEMPVSATVTRTDSVDSELLRVTRMSDLIMVMAGQCGRGPGRHCRAVWHHSVTEPGQGPADWHTVSTGRGGPCVAPVGH